VGLLLETGVVIAFSGAPLHFGGIVAGLQIVRYRDNRQQNRGQHGQSDQLCRSARKYRPSPPVALVSKPQAPQNNGDQHPRQIGEEFHRLEADYIRAALRLP